MDISNMTMEQVEARAEEIREAQSAEDADLEALAAEAEQLAARHSALIEEQKAAQEAVARGAGEVIKREDKNMTEREVRQSKAYIEAYANYVKGGCVDDTECRSILTDNAATVEGALQDYAAILSGVFDVNLPLEEQDTIINTVKQWRALVTERYALNLLLSIYLYNGRASRDYIKRFKNADGYAVTVERGKGYERVE